MKKIIEITRQLKCSLVPWSGNLPSFIDKIWFVILKQCSLISLFILLHRYLMMSICPISVVHYFFFHNFFCFLLIFSLYMQKWFYIYISRYVICISVIYVIYISVICIFCYIKLSSKCTIFLYILHILTMYIIP